MQCEGEYKESFVCNFLYIRSLYASLFIVLLKSHLQGRSTHCLFVCLLSTILVLCPLSLSLPLGSI